MADTKIIVPESPNPAPARGHINAMDLVGRAVANGASVDQVDKLIELVKFNDQREAMRAFNQAFTAAQAEFPDIPKTKKAHNSMYAPLDVEVKLLRPVLMKHGFSFRHEISENDDKSVSVRCILAHKEGHSESATLSGPADKSGSKNDIQAIGSSVTYLRRYTFESVTGLVTKGQDDDGAGSQKISEQQAADIQSLISEHGFDEAKALAHYKLESWADLPLKNFEAVCRDLLAKGKAKAGRSK